MKRKLTILIDLQNEDCLESLLKDLIQVKADLGNKKRTWGAAVWFFEQLDSSIEKIELENLPNWPPASAAIERNHK